MKTLKYRRKRKGDFVSYLIFCGLDMAAIIVAFAASYFLRFFVFQAWFKNEPPDPIRYVYALPVVVLIFLVALKQRNIYVFDILRRRIDEIVIIFKAIIFAAVILMSFTFLYRDFTYSRAVFFLLCAFSFVFICAFRDIAYTVDGWVRLAMKTRIRVLVLGTNRSARQVVRRIRRSYRNRYEVVGVLSGGNFSQEKHFESAPILGNLDDVFMQIDHTAADEVILTVPDFSADKLTDLFLKCENELITFLKIPDLFGISTSGVEVHYIDNVPLIGLKESPLDKMSSRFVKRAFDITSSLAGLIVLSPLFILIAIFVKLSDGGPIFYQQNRIGMDGRSFFIYKFRTMQPNAESKTGPVWATKNDERTTPIGRVLRRLNLDEIPQLWNVLIGTMSMVGPRPERPHFVGKFRTNVPRYMARHKIKAGITGWAQVNGLRGDTSISERTKYDLYYYENWSLLLDVKILFLTLFAFRNAY